MSEFLPDITISKSLKDLAREVARVQGQPAGKEEGSGTSDENERKCLADHLTRGTALPVPTCACLLVLFGCLTVGCKDSFLHLMFINNFPLER